jgi:hypothetical protein
MEHRSQLLSRLARSRPEHLVPGMFLGAALVSADARGVAVGELARKQFGESGRLMENYRYPVAWMLGMLDVIGQAAEAAFGMPSSARCRPTAVATRARTRPTVLRT